MVNFLHQGLRPWSYGWGSSVTIIIMVSGWTGCWPLAWTRMSGQVCSPPINCFCSKHYDDHNWNCIVPISDLVLPGTATVSQRKKDSLTKEERWEGETKIKVPPKILELDRIACLKPRFHLFSWRKNNDSLTPTLFGRWRTGWDSVCGSWGRSSKQFRYKSAAASQTTALKTILTQISC